jgi:hypothetical protein
MELWSVGVREYWSDGVLERWSDVICSIRLAVNRMCENWLIVFRKHNILRSTIATTQYMDRSRP